MKVVLLCPSLHQACGIASYTKYVVDSLVRRGHTAVAVATTNQAYHACDSHDNILIIQHEYGLYERFAFGHESPTVSELLELVQRLKIKNKLNKACIVMHTFHPYDHVYSCINRQLICSSIPVYHLNKLGASLHGLHFLEHGVFHLKAKKEWQIFKRTTTEFKLGSFGFLSPNKDIKGLIDSLCNTGATLIANYATNDLTYADEIRTHAISKGVKMQLTTDFLSESNLLKRLNRVNACIAMQSPISHYATSGSIRFLMNLGVPIICTAKARQFDDLGNSVIRSSIHDLASWVINLRDNSSLYVQSQQRLAHFYEQHEIGLIYDSLITDLLQINSNQSIHFESDDFRTPIPALDWSQLGVSSLNSGEDTPSSESQVYQHLRGSISSFLGTAKPPFRLPRSFPLEDLSLTPNTPLSQIRRYLSNEKILTKSISHLSQMQGQPDSVNPSLLKLSTELSCGVADCDEINDLIDAIYNISDSDRWRVLSERIHDYFVVESLSNSCLDVPIEYALLTSLMPTRDSVVPLLKLLLPSLHGFLLDFVSQYGLPPERLTRRGPWLTKLHHDILQSSHHQLSRGCETTHLLSRHLFCVEELLWIDHLSFFQACSIGLLKSGSPSISQLWDVEADNVYRRFFHILSCYSQGVFQAGHPLVLVFSWLNDNLDDTWERRSNRVGRTARLIISDHPSMSLSSMPPRVRSSQSPFPHADSQVKSLIRRFISDSPTSQLSTPKNEIHDWLSSNHPHLALAYISPVQARRIIEYKDTLGHDI